MRVSFDFDGTLDKESVQLYAKELIIRSIDVWICTSRFSEEDAIKKGFGYNCNSDLFIIANNLNIPNERVHFCGMSEKYKFFKGSDFIWHLDDDWVELDAINKHTKTKGISVLGNKNWIKKCNKYINAFNQ